MNHRAIFGLSYSLALLDDLKRQEPATHTRRYRDIDRLETETLRLLGTYPSPAVVPGTALHDLACKVYDAMDAALRQGVESGAFDAGEGER